MLSVGRTRLPSVAARCRQACAARLASTTNTSTTDNPVPVNQAATKAPVTNVSATNAVPTSSTGSYDGALQESPDVAEEKRVMQAPNRKSVWSRSQRPRSEAQVGPRFEQAIMEDQPRPMAAVELIHKQPVRWTHNRTVSCNGGGGPLGHPRIFINVDKPQICHCTYCGLPFAHEHHRKHLESLPSTTYPLHPTGDNAEVPESLSNTGKPFEVR